MTWGKWLISLVLAGGVSFAGETKAGLLNDLLRAQTPAWQQVDIGGQLRLRSDNHEKAGSFPNNDFISNAATNSNRELLARFTSHLGYTPVPWLTLFAEGRVSLENGDKRNPSPDRNPLDLHQAYLRLGDLKELPVQLQVGRQELIYSDLRWLAAGEWSNTGRRFDAVKLHLENEFGWLDAFVSHPVYVDWECADHWNRYDYFSGFYASSKKLLPWQETQFFFLSDNTSAEAATVKTPTMTGPNARDLYAVGTVMKSLPGELHGWDYSVELIGQTGTLATNATQGRRLDLCAWAAFISGGYTFEQAWGTPRLGLGYDYGSGDSDSHDGKVGTVQGLFGDNHRYYGQMDLFGFRNMHIPRISGALKPARELTFTADYLMFWLDDTHDLLYPETAAGRTQNGYGIHPEFNSFVGSEIDFVIRYQARPWLNFLLAYGHFFVGDYIRETVAVVPANGRAVDADWFCAQMLFNF